MRAGDTSFHPSGVTLWAGRLHFQQYSQPRCELQAVAMGADRFELPIGELTCEALDAGDLVEHEGLLLIKPKRLVKALRQALPDEQLKRVDITPEARRLGLVEAYRPLLPDGSRPRVWAFPQAIRVRS